MFTLFLILFFSLQTPESKPQAPTERGATTLDPSRKAKADVAAATPEQALRNFFVAMVTKDVTTLRDLTLPTDDFDWLLMGQALPANQIEVFKAQMAGQPIRTLRPGDEFTLAGNRKLKVLPEEVTADRAVLVPEAIPLPMRLRKVEGRWRVDAGPIIAARKAAEAARKKATRPAAKKTANDQQQ